MGCLRRSTRVHLVPGSMAPVTFDLGPARSRSAAYHFPPFAGGQQTMSILLASLWTGLRTAAVDHCKKASWLTYPLRRTIFSLKVIVNKLCDDQVFKGAADTLKNRNFLIVTTCRLLAADDFVQIRHYMSARNNTLAQWY